MQDLFYVIAYTVGLVVLCCIVLAYAYVMSNLFANAAVRRSPNDDHSGTRR